MSETRKLAAILAADVGVREHRASTSENRADGSAAIVVAADWG